VKVKLNAFYMQASQGPSMEKLGKTRVVLKVRAKVYISWLKVAKASKNNTVRVGGSTETGMSPRYNKMLSHLLGN